uniref:ANK_REP_REGION domain-containing protein n=2 Tax=Caenorhabditis tropicalis TaxID=1561998 RepID=A0A1I7SYH7_9PELO
EEVKTRIKYIEEWDGASTIGTNFISTIENCLKNISEENSSVDFQSMIRVFNHTKTLSLNMEKYYKSIEEALSKEEQIIKALEYLKEKGSEWKTANLYQKRYNLLNLMGLNGSEEVEEMLRNVEKYIFPMLEKHNKSQLELLIAGHPDMGNLLKAPDLFHDSQIISISHCLSEKNFASGKLEKIIKRARDVKEFQKKTTKEMMDSVTNYMEFVSKIVKLLKEAEGNMKKKLSWETKELNDFSTAGDILQALSTGRNILMTMCSVERNQSILKEAIGFEFNSAQKFWKKWKLKGVPETKEMIEQVKELNEFVMKNRNSNIKYVGNVFQKASEIPGLHGIFDDFSSFKSEMSKIKQGTRIIEIFEKIQDLSLDFSSFSDKLHYASVNIIVLNTFLHEFAEEDDGIISRLESIPILQMILILFAMISIIFLFISMIYSLTPSGRKRWRRFFLTRFASKETRELQWRYSFWLDQESEKNALCEAVREINFEQVKSLIDRGVFINVYNQFGNTPLHAAAKYGHVKIVEYLIKNGADRKAFNSENKIPEQLLNESVQSTIQQSLTSITGSVSEGTKKSQQSEAESFSEIYRIFDKHREKKYRQRLPDLLPTMAYRIRIDPRIVSSSCNGSNVRSHPPNCPNGRKWNTGIR